jgi:hypothetical protein
MTRLNVKIAFFHAGLDNPTFNSFNTAKHILAES